MCSLILKCSHVLGDPVGGIQLSYLMDLDPLFLALALHCYFDFLKYHITSSLDAYSYISISYSVYVAWCMYICMYVYMNVCVCVYVLCKCMCVYIYTIFKLSFALRTAEWYETEAFMLRIYMVLIL